ncbi:MAG: SprB repeat-containing protein [Bacteroidia bacterium]|nr:SprB repeat-containing protein [Bacteroidia bacterium]
MLAVCFVPGKSYSQTMVTFSPGAFIVNMGVVPQTIGNGLKPYGLIYHLIKTHFIPVYWIIDPNKVKDGIDFSYNGVDYRGGAFVIAAEYINPTVIFNIDSFINLGVVGSYTTAPLTLPVYKYLTIYNVPRWTLDYQNGALAQPYFANAGIPPSAYGGLLQSGWKTPAQLGPCDDIFVMPHADPTWATHQNLYYWNLTYKGAIWLGCHAGSALHNLYNPANTSQQCNFLTEKITSGTEYIAPVSGSTSYCQNSLVLWTNHSGGTPPYTYDNGGDPVMQFMGGIDLATQNGSEQIYVPCGSPDGSNPGGWRATTVVGGYDPDQVNKYLGSNLYKYRAAVIAYGPGMGDSNRGMVMLEAAHKYSGGTGPDYVAAQRAFFNFSFIAARDQDPGPVFHVQIGTLVSGSVSPITLTLTGNYPITDFSVSWSSSCGGSFDPVNAASTNFTAPPVSGLTNCLITVTLTELNSCAHVYKYSTNQQIICGLQVTTTLSPPCFGITNGSIAMSISGGGAPFIWSWTKSGGGTGSGTGTTISGLAPGTYTVSVTSSNGTGCGNSFTSILTEDPAITATATPSPVLCNGTATGSISLAVSGGSSGYTYDWGGGVTSQNRSSIIAGTYNVTVTDSKNCTATATANVTQPDPIVITPTITNVVCYGQSTGAISISVSGGITPYAYAWSDGSALQNRTGLAAGTYGLTVTDNNTCKQTASYSVTQSGTALSLSATSVNVLCNGASTGSIDLSPTGGTTVYTYLWSNSATTQDLSGLSAGTYSVTVTDFKNCTAVLSKTITQNPVLSLSAALTPVTCPPPASPNGAINVTASGGTSPYTYKLDNGSYGSTFNFTGLAAGSHTVYVKDTNGCITSATVTLNTLYSNPVQPGQINY